MTPQSFDQAQQAASIAYAMTIDATGDMAQAAADYKAVMSAFYAADAKHERQYIAKQRDLTPITAMAEQMVAMMHAETVELQRRIEAAWPTLPEIEY